MFYPQFISSSSFFCSLYTLLGFFGMLSRYSYSTNGPLIQLFEIVCVVQKLSFAFKARVLFEYKNMKKANILHLLQT